MFAWRGGIPLATGTSYREGKFAMFWVKVIAEWVQSTAYFRNITKSLKKLRIAVVSYKGADLRIVDTPSY